MPAAMGPGGNPLQDWGFVRLAGISDARAWQFLHGHIILRRFLQLKSIVLREVVAAASRLPNSPPVHRRNESQSEPPITA